MVVTAVLEPITRICPDSCSGLGGVGEEAGGVSSGFEESLNKDGDDAPLYLERNIQRVLKKLEETENEEGKE